MNYVPRNTRYASQFTLYENEIQDLRKITYEIISVLCKTNPILSAVGGLQMNVSNIITRNYKNFIPLAGQKNKPNSNPIKANLKRAKMNANDFITKDYRKKDDFLVRINKPNLVRRRRIAK